MKIKFLGLILFYVYSCQLFAASPLIKVRIGKKLQKVNVSGIDLERYIVPRKSKKTFSGQKSIEFNCVSNLKSKRLKPIRLASISSLTGLINWEEDRYKGRLHIQTSEGLDGCDLINELNLDDYLSTLLPKEMNSTWPIEALKAQAVAARSYALFKIQTKQVGKSKGFETYYDLENSEKHQVNGDFFDVTKKTKKAAYDTKGEILVNPKDRMIPIFFHSKCGGRTLTPDQVWSNVVEGYKSVNCTFCHKHGRENWNHIIPKNQMAYSLTRVLKNYNKDKGSVNVHKITMMSDHKREESLKFYSGASFKKIKKSRLRSVLGRSILPSNYFNLSEQNDRYIVSGSGFGHGVGLCQFGAKELALQGFNYKQILAYYFPLLRLKKVY